MKAGIIALLLLLAACNGRPNGTQENNPDDPGPINQGSGKIVVTVSATGAPVQYGYIVTISNGQKRTVHADQAATFTTRRTGTHAVALESVPAGCLLAEQNPLPVNVRSFETVPVEFSVSCQGPSQATTIRPGSQRNPR